MTRRIVSAFVASALAVAVLAACGMPTDSKPRPIPRHAVSDLLNPTTTSPNGGSPSSGATVRLYFLCGQRITEVLANATGTDPRSVLDAQLAGPSDALRTAGYTTYLPPGTRILSLDVSASGVLFVQLSKEMDTLSGMSARNAYAQLVFAATGTAGVKQVAFQAPNGTSIEVPTDSASKKTVSRADYSQIPSGPAATSGPPGTPTSSGTSGACTSQ